MQGAKGLEVSEDATQNKATSGENNMQAENEATVNPSSDSNALNSNKQDETASVAAVAVVKTISEELPVRTIPLTPLLNDDSIEMLHSEAIKLEIVREDAVFEEVDSAGRGGGARFVANTDPNRQVKTYLPRKGEFVYVPIGRNSDKVSEGGIVGSAMIELGFGCRFFGFRHKQQVSLVLVNGRELIGYVLKGEGKGARRAFYFPKNEAERVITLPKHGKQIKLQVARLLIG